MGLAAWGRGGWGGWGAWASVGRAAWGRSGRGGYGRGGRAFVGHVIRVRKALPIKFGGLQERQGSHHVSACKSERVLNAAVHVRFCGEMNDAINLLFLHKLEKSIKIAYVHLHEPIVWLILYVLEIGEVTCIGQGIQIDDFIIRILVDEKTNDMASYESRATGNNNISLHI